MSSWGDQPVIPGTFYPLSDGPSIRNHRITLARLSHLLDLSVSQSSTLYFTLCVRLPTVLREPLRASVTFWEATTPVKLPTMQCPQLQGRLVLSNKGWYFNVDSTTWRPASKSPNYPTHLLLKINAKSYSEGSRGLSVPWRVTGIFTDTTISPGSWRQCSTRYTIRAGRNLPDKEFRYLRTVIVTAAVYWGFKSSLWIAPTSSLNLPAPGRYQAYTSSFDFAGPCVFAKQLVEPFTEIPSLRIRFIPKLQGQFA